MEYRGYKVYEEKEGIIVENIRDFDLMQTFECGQCFRWVREQDGSYTGVAMGRVVNVSLDGSTLTVRNSNLKDFKVIWFDYFDLGRDYGRIKADVQKDGVMEAAIAFGGGIRLLKQDIWEALISFILSINNRIPMIKKVVSAISKVYGNELKYNGGSYYTFPEVKRLASAGLEELSVCRGGFRCRYLSGTSKIIRDGFELEALKSMSSDKARETLNLLPGVGDKVADCTLLYSGTHYDVFPTDVWVKRVMEELYFKREASLKEIRSFSAEYFGELAGFAQQYLFYYARENKIGVR